MSVSQPHLTDLPEEILERIFTFLSYHEVSRLREVCRLFDCIGKEILKRAFRQLEEQILCYRKELKQQLPRRESERRKHPLSGIRRLESRAAVGDSARPTRLVEPARQNADVLSRKRPLLPAASSASSMEEGNSDPSVSSPRKVRVMEVTQPASASSSDSS
nr:unnamed protein product [Spirometra erinaceieuropaei]